MALITLRAAGMEPGSLLATSALLTAVIGLSLQDTLGNLFAGLAIHVQRPFKVGDWIKFNDHLEHVGRVAEINWTLTKRWSRAHPRLKPNARACSSAGSASFFRSERGTSGCSRAVRSKCGVTILIRARAPKRRNAANSR